MTRHQFFPACPPFVNTVYKRVTPGQVLTSASRRFYFYLALLVGFLITFLWVPSQMCVSEDELQKDMSKVFDHIINAREDVVRQSLEIQELKSDFADVRQEMNAKEDNMRHNMEDIVCNEVKKATKYLEDIVSNEVKKATKCLEEKLDALLVKLSEKDN